MAQPKAKSKTVETLRHDKASRRNIPTAEFRSVMERAEQSPVQVAYERRNRDLDPQLVWRGKDAQDWSDLVVQAPPLFIQEKVHPMALVDDLRRQRGSGQPGTGGDGAEAQPDLFADFNGLPSDDVRTEFYRHDANWSNRMILGDSLQVMASLAEREGLRGKVQCIYLDPPYGIKFNSNFQWSTTSRDVKDGKAEHISREPEQVKAFRDTWRDGIHSYLTYLRDRLIVARELLAKSGSMFVQIGDENLHRVRALRDEVLSRPQFSWTRIEGESDVTGGRGHGEVEAAEGSRVGADGIACWFIDTDYNEESFFVRHAYFLGANDPYKALKTTLKAEIDADAWASLHSDISRPFDRPESGRIAVKVINHLGDEVMKVFRV